MKTLLTIFITLVSNIAFAKNIYFSSVSGNDATGTGSIASPYASLNKLNNIFYTLLPGDSVLLKRGESFCGTIVINKAGTKANPIVIGAYGTGAKPVITSLKTMVPTSLGGNKYESQALTGASNVQVVEVSGIPQALARWPNSDAANGGWNTVDAVASWNGTTNPRTGGITDAALSGAPSVSSWPGVEIINRTQRWVLARDIITSKSSNTINFTSTNDYTPQVGWGYFLQGASAFLDKDFEWVYNSSTQKVTMYHAGGAPQNVKIATRDTIIKATSSSYDNIVIRDVVVTGSNRFDIWLRGDTCKLINVDIKNSGEIGLVLGGNASTADSCTWDYNNNEAVFLQTTGNRRKITNFFINHTGTMPGMGLTDYAYNGIEKRGVGDTVMYGTIKNTGKVAVREGYYDYQLTYGVWVDSANLVAHDNGAIYAFGRANDATGNPIFNVGRKISHCIVTNTIGAPYGTVDPIVYPCHLAIPLYLDNYTSGLEVEYCTIVGGERGMFINTKAKYNNVHHNTVFNGDQYQFFINTGTTGTEAMAATNKLRNNIFFAKEVLQRATWYEFMTSSATYSLESFGSIDSNYYVRPIDTTNAMIKDHTPVITLNTFRSNHPTLEVHGKPSPLAVTSVNNVRIEYNATTSNKVVDLGAQYSDVYSNLYTSVTLFPYTGIALIKTSATNTPPTVSITAPSDGSIYTAPATVNIVASASDADGTITKVDFYNGSTLLGTDASAPYTYSWASVGVGGYSLTAKATDNLGNVTTSASISITVTAPANTPPTVSIANPTVDTTIVDIDSVFIKVTTADADGTISLVKFYDNGNLFHTELASPFSFTWYNVSAGVHVVRAVSFDDDGDSTTSGPRIINFTKTATPLTIEATVDTIYCHGGSANIYISGLGGTPPYGGDVGTHLETVGSHHYDISDAAAGTASIDIVLTEPSTLTASNTPGTISVYGGTTNVTINGSGGTPTYQYKIGSGSYQSGNVFTLGAGSYTATVKDSFGCTATTSFTLVQPPSGCNCRITKHGKIIYMNP